jgi:deferrochelatase/peroxidase EfeB
VENTPQEGIYFEKGSTPGKSFGIIFLRAVPGSSALEVGNSLSKLWKELLEWRLHYFDSLSNKNMSVKGQNFSVLLAFGSKLFDLPDIRRPKPRGLSPHTTFLPPRKIGGGQLLKDSGMFYDDDILTNEIGEDEVAIQFISDDDVQISTAIVESYRIVAEESLSPTKFYTGFRRSNQRNWLGFHDGLSNIPRKYRKEVIFIDDANIQNKWTNGGTYMSFIRFIIKIQDWWRTDILDQEIIIGREKISGCTIKGIDRNGNIVRDRSCPTMGTKYVTEEGNEKYRSSTSVDSNYSKLNLSHVSTMHTSTSNNKMDIAIFRQGYEFLEPDRKAPGFRVGLNFVSFQNDPYNVFRLLTKWKKNTSETQTANGTVPLLNNFVSVISGLNLFVPPMRSNEQFPGSSIFYEPTQSSVYRR